MRACSTPPTRPIRENAKFYGDIQEKLTAITTDLIFFELELNKIDEAAARARAAGSGARALQAVDRRPAQGEALSAGRAAGAPVPREVDHRARRLEPALQRDHDRAALRGGGRAGAARARADAQFPDASRRPQAAGGGRGAGQGVQGERRASSR